jgi:ribosomal protein S18 acetylase RimI-like enzyme
VADKIPGSTTFKLDEAATVAPALSLRPVERADEPLLVQIFAESHCAGFELLGLEPGALAGLIRMQFQARQAQYRAHPAAAEYLMCAGTAQDEIVLGSCWLSDTAEQLRVLDIAVLVEHRRRGVARTVLTELCARAAAEAKPVRLSVWHENHPARELYRALGFLPSGAGPDGDLGSGYLELQFVPDRAPRLRAGAR